MAGAHSASLMLSEVNCLRSARVDGIMGGGRFNQEQSSVGLKVALRIIAGWQASPTQACRILRISHSTYRRASQDCGAGRRLDQDQQQRIGLVLSIHASLRTTFANQANVKGFPGFINENEFFEGRSPLKLAVALQLQDDKSPA